MEARPRIFSSFQPGRAGEMLRKDRERQRHAKRLTATAVNPHKARRPAVSINGPAAGSQCMPMRGVTQIISERGIIHAAGRDNTTDT
jgi:hypothetical protein